MVLALINSSIFEVAGLNVYGLVSALCRIAQVDFDEDNLRSQDIFIALQKVLIFGMPRPFSFLAIYLVVLLVIEGLLLFLNLEFSLNFLYSFETKAWDHGCYVSEFREAHGFITVILPKTVKNLCFHELNSLLTFSKQSS